MILYNIIQGTTLSRRALYSSSYDRCCSLDIQTILNNNNCLSTISTSSIESFYSRYFHSTPAAHANKKRRVSASSARKKKQQQLTKQQNLKAKKKKKQQQSTTTTYAPLTVGSILDPISKQQKANRQQRDVPRSFLVQTASKFAYIAKCAVFNEQTGEMYVDPKSLFSELNNTSTTKNNYQQKKKTKTNKLPRIFRNSHLEYFSPSSFPNFEPPNYGTPEVAFLGRSNVGKSSLINALSSMIQRGGGTTTGTTGKTSVVGELAKTSKRPGRTQTINYFGLLSNNEVKKEQSPNLCKLFLVDLPGFGYAAAPDESVDEWQRKTQEFLISRASTQDDTSSGSIQPWPDSNNDNLNKLNEHQQRINQHNSPSPPLKRLYLLLDSRLPDPPRLDISVMGWCDEYSIPYTIVLTKVDGSSKATCVRLANQLCMRYHSLYMGTTTNHDSEEVYMDPVIYLATSKDGVGMEELLLSVENNMFSMVENDDEDSELDENVDGE